MIKAQFIIGAAGSNSGKTTLTLGLLRAFRERGLRTQPFKCGPDYIDTKYHQLASGCESVNLDGYFASHDHLRDLYHHYGREADVLVTEGVMGLFDGYNGMWGSTAALAELLEVPVLLVVNARSTAYSVAALIYGYRNFRPEVKIAGVIFNQVASENHYRTLAKACRDAQVECYGYLPRMKDIELPSRHLGLTLDSRFLFDEYSLRIARQLEKTVDIDRLLRYFTIDFRPDNKLSFSPLPCPISALRKKTMRIAVARDEAFNFVYRENLDVLRRYGEITFFSPMKDTELPKADFVYLPGGYPEFFLSELASNVPMKCAIRDYVEAGGYMLAECGGMMYLCKSIVGMDHLAYPMVGILPKHATMEGMRLHLGYRIFDYEGKTFKGHEFHYSSIPMDPDYRMELPVRLYSAYGDSLETPIYHYKNVIAGYTHLYWGESSPFGFWK